ncbi:MAG: class I SAM-dependent methyltransferase [Deltaproteobacteria bacterium HGW-Deltaproteobacteria-14]|jgi:SAM-dependent methyltransferase|nr:MAG: class I SAM-dependent methyltransferase [Deltaproteobacteria bacterium HGW-Deltaproteobacteria-14]
MTDTRQSWNVATRHHNAHKGDQAAFLRAGGEVLFDEELALLGDLAGKRLVHLQCNSGQDTLCLARRGAVATGVDFSDEAIAFARGLSAATGIAADFELSEVVAWLEATEERFELAFSSYGAVGWLPDLAAWARGVARVLVPGGRIVYVEFHPLVWSFAPDLTPTGDDYFATAPFEEPVTDYVAQAGAGLNALAGAVPGDNPVPARSWQYGLGDIVSALAAAGLVIETLREYPYANGCNVHPALELGPDRRWRWPAGTANVPLMFGLSARRPGPISAV